MTPPYISHLPTLLSSNVLKFGSTVTREASTRRAKATLEALPTLAATGGSSSDWMKHNSVAFCPGSCPGWGKEKQMLEEEHL